MNNLINKHFDCCKYKRTFFTDVGPASVMVGNLVQGNRLAMAQGRDLGLVDDEDMRRVSISDPIFISYTHTSNGFIEYYIVIISFLCFLIKVSYST